jgi:arylsulfatase A-like enzyme
MTLAQNVFIFVADSLRFDYLPQSVADRGVAFETVAQTTFTAPSFTTLTTGLYPPQHGVLSWQYRLAESTKTVFDCDGVNGGFWQVGEVAGHEIYPILRQEGKTALSDLDEPFVYIERNDDPHLPYAGTDASSVDEYFRTRGNDCERIRREYRGGVELSVERFEARLNELEERGLLDDTLVIFTSDHGELLGERGTVSHQDPACPELAFVPTVFIHDSLSEGDFHVDPGSELIEHVDVVETALAALGRENELATAGVNMRTTSRPREWGYNHVDSVQWYGKPVYSAESIWWPGRAGHVVHRNRAAFRLARVLYDLTRRSSRHVHRARMVTYLRTYLRHSATFGEPPMASDEALSLLEAFSDELSSSTVEASTVELDEEVEKHLNRMGYL